MDNFIVSARKYRPVTFDTVVGQKSITTTLKNAIKNKQIAQAFLFTGPRGVGKTTCARILAKTINCKNITENIEPCNVCDSCKAFNTSASFNVHELDAASNNSVDDIRSLVDQVRIPPQAVAYKVYIIDEVHMLSQQAFNAFLKTLEEPPPYAKFILATTEKHKILPTILSRCQIFDFNRITVDDIAKHLEYVAISENFKAEPEALHMIAQKADGGLRDALSIFDQIASFSGSNITYENVLENLNILDVNVYFEITDFIKQNATTQILLKINDIYEKGHDAHNFINGLADHLRDLLVSKDPETILLLETSPSIKEKYKSHARSWQPDVLLKCLEICSKADVNYKNVANKRLHVELALLQMCSLFANALGAKPPIQTEATPVKAPQELNPQAAISSPIKPTVVEEKKEEYTHTKPVSTEKMPEKQENINVSKGSISLASLLQETSDAEEKKTSTVDVEDLADVPTEDFSEEQLHKAWAEYTEQSTHSPNYKSIITNSLPKKKDDTTIIFSVINPFQETEIKSNIQELLAYLRNKLGNFKLNVEIKINPEEKSNVSKPFTVKDKYKTMSDKNPDIVNLKNKLDLDFDY